VRLAERLLLFKQLGDGLSVLGEYTGWCRAPSLRSGWLLAASVPDARLQELVQDKRESVPWCDSTAGDCVRAATDLRALCDRLRRSWDDLLRASEEFLLVAVLLVRAGVLVVLPLLAESAVLADSKRSRALMMSPCVAK
jgi:hypothetical protein